MSEIKNYWKEAYGYETISDKCKIDLGSDIASTIDYIEKHFTKDVTINKNDSDNESVVFEVGDLYLDFSLPSWEKSADTAIIMRDWIPILITPMCILAENKVGILASIRNLTC